MIKTFAYDVENDCIIDHWNENMSFEICAKLPLNEKFTWESSRKHDTIKWNGKKEQEGQWSELKWTSNQLKSNGMKWNEHSSGAIVRPHIGESKSS
jgi:hypothetical protein